MSGAAVVSLPGPSGAPVAAGGVAHLYVHLPFCTARCGYCAFVVETGKLDRRDDYLTALLSEINNERHRIGALQTCYLGGGTPSLMRPRRIARLLDALAPHLASGAEVSMEVNPETVDRTQLVALRAAGVTRVSFGVQSLRPHVLASLDRAATPRQGREAVACARDAGFDSVSIDLLFGVPGQTPEDLEADIAEVAELGADHVSWYELEMKPGSALERMGTTLPDEDDTADAYERIVAALEGQGMRWYETANFARPGKECRHSLAYWHAADYLGVGVGAVSTHAGRRWRNAPGIDRYVAALGRGEGPARAEEPLDAATRRRERWMLALRLDRPLDTALLGAPDHPEALEWLEQEGLLRRSGTVVELTRRGRFVQNAIAGTLMDYAAPAHG